MDEYQKFLDSKKVRAQSYGKIIDVSAIHPMLFPFQRDTTRWAIRGGRRAIFARGGLGKTFMQLEYSRLIDEPTLIVAPLTVCEQTIDEAKRINIEVKYVRQQDEVNSQFSITNYDIIKHFDPAKFNTVVLDESSILKSITSKTRELLIEMFSNTPYRLCCTATPAPNDIAEIANHAEFLGIMRREEILANFFVHDNEGWRLRGHGEEKFYEWLASWSMSIRRPSDLGYSDKGYDLTELDVKPVFVRTDYVPEGQLFHTGLKGISDRAAARRGTLDERVAETIKMVNSNPEQAIIWCGLDDEQDCLAKNIKDNVSVFGSQSPDRKKELIKRFQRGEAKVLISKIGICGYGMNFQNAHWMYFVGLSDSWEDYIQALWREHRFGQTETVHGRIILSEIEDEIYNNVMRKEAEANRMTENLIKHVAIFEKDEIMNNSPKEEIYQTKIAKDDLWTAMLGDSCEIIDELPDESIDFSVFSPPFAALYTYSATDRDLGNSRNEAEFFEHFGFVIRKLFKKLKTGRICAVHVADTPAMLVRDGYIGLKDLSGDIVKAFQKEGWIWDARIPIDKNQQAQSIRTHSKALTMTQMKKDRSWLRPALPDYILKFRKPGDNQSPVAGGMSGDEWIELANPTWPNEQDRCAEWGAFATWYGIQESDTLQGWMAARGSKDDRHICPLQLKTIRNCIRLWTNPGETVFSPFAGIGSEGDVAIELGRKFIGIELKPEYFKVMVRNLRAAVQNYFTGDLFGHADVNGKSIVELDDDHTNGNGHIDTNGKTEIPLLKTKLFQDEQLPSESFDRLVLDGKNGKSELKVERVPLVKTKFMEDEKVAA